MTDISRRKFMKRVGATGATLPALSVLAAASAEGTIPRRTLGRTGEQVSILAFGGGSRFLAYEDEGEALRILNRALDLGITYVDSAFSYGKGKSEERIGKGLGARRKAVFLATKMPDRGYDEFLRTLEGSLKRLQTERVDLLHIHSLGNAEDLEKVTKDTIRALYRARDEKMTRFIGITSHTDGAVMKQALERFDLNCVQMALNASRNNQFEELALPAANRKQLGIIAMKVTAQEALVGQGAGKAAMEPLVRYSLSLPVTTAVIGMPKPEFLEENVQHARAFRPLNREEAEQVHRQVAPAQAALTRFFQDHLDA